MLMDGVELDEAFDMSETALVRVEGERGRARLSISKPVMTSLGMVSHMRMRDPE